MRVRTKKWVRPELEESYFVLQNAYENRGKWHSLYKDPSAPLWLELGCGKGGFISQIAPQNPSVNFLAIDLISEMLGQAKRKVEAAYGQHPVKNLLLCSWDIERIESLLAPQDQVERIFINFCNPWPKPRHHKKRLVHTRQLLHYKTFLQAGGLVYFKTDDDAMFADSLTYFKEAGYEIVQCIDDLHSHPEVVNYPTEHELMFAQKGIKIKYVVAKMA